MAKFASLWVGDMTRLERLSISSFIKNGHEHHIFLYDMKNAEKLPKEAIIHDANEIIPEDKIFADRIMKEYFQFADIFRLKLLKKYDFIWVDLDTICLSTEWENQKIVLCPFELDESSSESYSQNLTLNNSLFYINKNSYFLNELLRVAENYDHTKSTDPYALSPVLFTKLLIDNKKNYNQIARYIKPYWFTFPIHYKDIYKIYTKEFKDECDTLCRKSFSVHLWRNTLKHSKNGSTTLLKTMPEEGSWLYNAYQKYLPFSSRQDWQNL